MKPAGTYGPMDRALHRLAFSALDAQIAVAGIETSLYSDTLSRHPIRNPVFITSLPRAGTTLLLELLSPLPEFATHTYRVMPFVLCPMMWDRLSRPFRRRHEETERAHGDGLSIGFDSPEAFEEVLWLRFWKSHYHPDHIDPWDSTDIDEEFETFLRDHMRKIVSLGDDKDARGEGSMPRYLSKNNANIARLDLLCDMFPDARIVVPIRNPWDHALSMHNQHRRFARLHAEDGFALRYMEWLGHFEFGAAHRPIDISNWRGTDLLFSPDDRGYWLAYWRECYAPVLDTPREQIVLVDYDRLCRAPSESLQRLVDTLNIRAADTLLAGAERIHPPTRYGGLPTDEERPPLLRCDAIAAALKARAI